MSLITDFLATLNSMRPPNWKSINGYSSLADFVLKHGQRFTPQPLPKKYQRGIPRQCYRNAANLAIEDHSLFYVEGYAMGIIPVNHAWCVDRAGNVIDPTWKSGTEYFGIVLRRSYLIARLQEQTTYGLLDRWEDGWPTLHHNPRRWKQRWPLAQPGPGPAASCPDPVSACQGQGRAW